MAASTAVEHGRLNLHIELSRVANDHRMRMEGK